MCDTWTAREYEEVSTFNSLRPKLVGKHEGRFVLIKGTDLIGIYDTRYEAVRDALKRFKSQTSLVDMITEIVSVKT